MAGTSAKLGWLAALAGLLLVWLGQWGPTREALLNVEMLVFVGAARVGGVARSPAFAVA
ncbi:MAG: hypothetical protein HC918_11445, partial [Oscillatoriales cyanobacterium SM2_1_8]|nr:hypothetical protein [Oscillatoriales cyanobacterium SM2_1_8]